MQINFYITIDKLYSIRLKNLTLLNKESVPSYKIKCQPRFLTDHMKLRNRKNNTASSTAKQTVC